MCRTGLLVGMSSRAVSSEAKAGSVFSPAATAADPQPAVDSSEAKISDMGNLKVGVCLRMTN